MLRNRSRSRGRDEEIPGEEEEKMTPEGFFLKVVLILGLSIFIAFNAPGWVTALLLLAFFIWAFSKDDQK